MNQSARLQNALQGTYMTVSAIVKQAYNHWQAVCKRKLSLLNINILDKTENRLI